MKSEELKEKRNAGALVCLDIQKWHFQALTAVCVSVQGLSSIYALAFSASPSSEFQGKAFSPSRPRHITTFQQSKY